jgi:nucleotide-binding universal stress UspA family protein
VYSRILVALDGSETAERILPYVIILAEKFGAVLTLLQAYTPLEKALLAEAEIASGFTQVGVLRNQKIRERADYLESIARTLRDRGAAATCIQWPGSAGATIVDYARRTGADLIAMTSHGRGGVRRLLLGSVADEVLRNAPCPVLVVRITE